MTCNLKKITIPYGGDDCAQRSPTFSRSGGDMPKAAHHSGDYQVRAKRVTDAAKADPYATCWRCGRTLDQHAPHRNGKRPWWTAGHVRDSDPLSPLAPEASTCNYQAGRAMQNAAHTVTTRAW